MGRIVHGPNVGSSRNGSDLEHSSNGVHSLNGVERMKREWKPPVRTFSEVETVYTVETSDQSWVEIDAIGRGE